MHIVHRVPSKGERREKWIAGIQKHQKFNESKKEFNVCHRHFVSSDLLSIGERKILKLSATPQIFDGVNKEDHRAENTESILRAKIFELEKQIDKQKIDHDVEIQKLKVNFSKVREKQTNRLKDIQKELSKKNTHIAHLTKVNEELRKEYFVSPDNPKFKNVHDFEFVLCG